EGRTGGGRGGGGGGWASGGRLGGDGGRWVGAWARRCPRGSRRLVSRAPGQLQVSAPRHDPRGPAEGRDRQGSQVGAANLRLERQSRAATGMRRHGVSAPEPKNSAVPTTR